MRHQPQGLTRLNNHPLAQGLDVAFVRLDQPGLVGPAKLTKTNTPTLIAQTYGVGWTFANGGTDSFSASNWPVLPDGSQYTYLVVTQLSATGAIGFLVNGDNSTRSFQFRVEANGAPTLIGFSAAVDVYSATGTPIPVGRQQVVVARHSASTIAIFQDGVQTASAASVGTPKGHTASEIEIGTRLANNLLGSIGLVLRWPRALTDDEVRFASANHWQLVQTSEDDDEIVAAAGGNYTLSADSGTFTIAGSATGLKADRKLAAAAGSFAVTGAAAGLRAGRMLVADTGAFAVSGNAAGIVAARQLAAASGSFSISGSDAGLKSARQLATVTGTFALTGSATELRAARMLTAASASFTLTGFEAGMRAARHLIAGAGSFSLTGNAAGLVYTPAGAVLAAQTGAFAISGAAAGLRADRRLTAEPGSFAILGSAAGVAVGRRLVADSGTFSMSGGTAWFSLARRLQADVGNYALTGYAVALTHSGAVIYARAPSGSGYAPRREERQGRPSNGVQSRPAATQRNSR
jgi:hypothetical protein